MVALTVRDTTIGWRVAFAFAFSAVVWAVIAYMLGSHEDRDTPGFWRPLIGVWSAIVALSIAWAA